MFIMKKISSPLGFKQKTESHAPGFYVIPFINVLLIAVFISILSSHFVYTPSLSIELPKASGKILGGAPSLCVVTVSQPNLIFFDGKVYQTDNLQSAFSKYIEKKKLKEPHLLAKLGQQVNMQTFYKICEIAHDAGFASVMLAGNPEISKDIKPDVKQLPFFQQKI